MTKQEIIDKINTGIRGQGSMVDIGGVLADVLTELAENSVPVVEVTEQLSNFGQVDLTEERYKELLAAPILLYEGLFYVKTYWYQLPSIQTSASGDMQIGQAFVERCMSTRDAGELDESNVLFVGVADDGRYIICSYEI